MTPPAAGSELGPWTRPAIAQEDLNTLAVVLDDPNPIHLDADAVRAAGLGDRPINQGPANIGYVAELLAEAVPGAVVEQLSVRLLSNVRVGDTVVAAGRVEASEPRGQGRELRCAVWLDVEDGARAVEGTAVLVLPEENGSRGRA